MSNPTMYYDYARMIQDARLQRSAAIGRALVRGAEAIVTAMRSAFVFDEAEQPASSTQRTLKLTSLGNER